MYTSIYILMCVVNLKYVYIVYKIVYDIYKRNVRRGYIN